MFSIGGGALSIAPSLDSSMVVFRMENSSIEKCIVAAYQVEEESTSTIDKVMKNTANMFSAGGGGLRLVSNAGKKLSARIENV